MKLELTRRSLSLVSLFPLAPDKLASFSTAPDRTICSIYISSCLVATKPVFRVSVKARLKPVSSATKTNQNIEILLEACLDMVLFKKGMTKALISLLGCAAWSGPLVFANPRRQVFMCRGPYATVSEQIGGEYYLYSEKVLMFTRTNVAIL